MVRKEEFRSIAHGGRDYAAAVDLRHRLLREPLGLVFSPQQLAAEKEDWHLIGVDCASGRVVATLILSPFGEGGVKMRQVAVDPSCQGQGWGRKLVAFAEAFAIDQGRRQVVLHAREAVVPFYEKLGYRSFGDRFEEVSLPHWKMQKTLCEC
ncbi:MAG: GNAT family N-acetyltransferase [Verrucomicrobiales bacterium]